MRVHVKGRDQSINHLYLITGKKKRSLMLILWDWLIFHKGRIQTAQTCTHTQTAPSTADAVSQAGLSEMEHPHKPRATSRATFLPIALVARLCCTVSVHSLRTVCSSWPWQRKGGMSIDKHTSVIRVAVMCHPLCTRRRAVGDLEEAGIPSRLSGKSG